MDDNFQFINPGRLVDNELELRLEETTPGDPLLGWVPAYSFGMYVGDIRVGGLNIRIGDTHNIVMYSGHIGYNVDSEHRGHHYAERGCRLLFPLAKTHGLTTIWITCNPDNIPSRRTCERLGAIMVEIVPLPNDCDMYYRGEREVCRYRIDLSDQ